MNGDLVRAIALGVGGLIVALILTAGAFAIAGQDISQPAGAPMFTAPSSPSPSHENGDRSPGPKQSPTVSPADDHGGASSGSDDDGSGSSEGSGGGSGSEDSGTGSDSSGSGSNAGSGSDSGSDGHEDD
jgi:hypothetical protein